MPLTCFTPRNEKNKMIKHKNIKRGSACLNIKTSNFQKISPIFSVSSAGKSLDAKALRMMVENSLSKPPIPSLVKSHSVLIIEVVAVFLLSKIQNFES